MSKTKTLIKILKFIRLYNTLNNIKRTVKAFIDNIQENLLPYAVLFGAGNVLFFMVKSSLVYFYRVVTDETVVMTAGNWIALVVFIICGYFLINYILSSINEIKNKKDVDDDEANF